MTAHYMTASEIRAACEFACSQLEKMVPENHGFLMAIGPFESSGNRNPTFIGSNVSAESAIPVLKEVLREMQRRVEAASAKNN